MPIKPVAKAAPAPAQKSVNPVMRAFHILLPVFLLIIATYINMMMGKK